ncbi:MAG: hypothetical protein V3T60_14940 [Candidatus Binatia bacterium]
MAQEQSWGTLPPHRKARFPIFFGMAAVIVFFGTVLFSIALIFLNHIFLPCYLPYEARPGRISLVFLVLSCPAYGFLTVAYILTRVGII